MHPQAAPRLSPSADPLPAAAFAEWLAGFIEGLAASARRRADEDVLGHAVDHADLERLMRTRAFGRSFL